MNKADLLTRENSWIARLAARNLGTDNVAIVVGNTIHLYGATRKQFLGNERWVKHEICHLQQYRRYGPVNFVVRYLLESLRHGYYNNKFEVEARAAEDL